MGFETADGQNGGPRSVQAPNAPPTSVPVLACQVKSARELAPLSPLRVVSVWGGKDLAQQSVEH